MTIYTQLPITASKTLASFYLFMLLAAYSKNFNNLFVVVAVGVFACVALVVVVVACVVVGGGVVVVLCVIQNNEQSIAIDSPARSVQMRCFTYKVFAFGPVDC
jgi:hypothetical protein